MDDLSNGRVFRNRELKPEPSVREKMDVCLLHFERLMQLKGENVAVREMRKHASWYLKGIRGNGKIRNAINQAETEVELRMLINSVVSELEEREAMAAEIKIEMV